MGLPVLVLGESGSGKTYSLKNFNEKEIIVFSVEKNRLPFKNKLNVIKNADYSAIGKEFKNPTKSIYVCSCPSESFSVCQAFTLLSSK